ncbi:glycosyltransferase [Chelatococcus sp. GCM10030263]|uniref:glycosyltransferase n=1 Tax=Chelatococcus sp. GCM10030263 TaxID=3273387 RepID=UPI00360F393D
MSGATIVPAISVAICTHNRFDDLRNALEALARQTLPAIAFEVLIVDNSSDHAARDAFRAVQNFPANAHWYDSSPPGLSRARNLALEKAKAPVVAFLDDDATPCRGWLEALAATFVRHPDAAAVAGPIEAKWPNERPDWLPPRQEGALTVLDLGPEDRPLLAHEYGYGANLAVRRDLAIACGAFDEQLGRNGGMSLLSGEEVALQDRLRAAGHVISYAAEARVLHRMRPERLTRNWFRSRMAWQAVSENLQHGGLPWPDWSRSALQQAARSLGIGKALEALLAPRDGEEFSDQLDVIQHLIALLLSAGSMPDKRLEALFSKVTIDAEEEAAAKKDTYRPAAAFPANTQIVFAEFADCNSHLLDLYGDLPHVASIELPGRAWGGDPRAALSYIEASLPPRARAVFLISLDPFSFNPAGGEALAEAIGRWGIPTFAIQHRPPQTAEEHQSLAKVAGCLTRVIALSEEVATRLTSDHQLTNVAALPHHPSTFRHILPGHGERARASIGAGPDHTVFGMVGEAQNGRGLKLLLSALDHLSSTVRQSVFFWMAGKAIGFDPEVISAGFAKRKIHARVDLRQIKSTGEHSVLTSAEYADAISAIDFGLLLQEPQRGIAGGVLSDYVWQGKRVIATRDSFIGGKVARHGLGLTLETERPKALAALIGQAVELHISGAPLGGGFEAYRQAHSPTATLKALQSLLETALSRQVPT